MGILSQSKSSKLRKNEIIVREAMPRVPRPMARFKLESTPANKTANGATSSPASSRRCAHLTKSAGCKRKKVATECGKISRTSSSRITSDDDDEDDDDDDDSNYMDRFHSRKRVRHGDDIDMHRCLAHPKLWKGQDRELKAPGIVHAAELANLKVKDCRPALKLSADEQAAGGVSVTVRYPGLSYRERFQLVEGKDVINAIHEILQIVHLAASNFIPEDERGVFLSRKSEDPGIHRRLERNMSQAVNGGMAFKEAIERYNKKLAALQRTGVVAKHLHSLHSVPEDLVAFIMEQVYDRTVAPQVELVNKYENGTDYVYGELRHSLVSRILKDLTKMTSDQIFVDLGSGVGNVVIQAALEIGCESWGCEMMTNPSMLAAKQKKEFEARCQLWGLNHGEVHLEEGNFRDNKPIQDVLKQAEVVLVNNQAFTAELNDWLVGIFLELKPGCKIVSLKSFVHDLSKGYKNDIASTILDAQKFAFYEGEVSWTNQPGNFFISTKKT